MLTPDANPGIESELLTRIGQAAELADHYPEDRDYWTGALHALQSLLSELTGVPLEQVRQEISISISLMRMSEEIDLLMGGFDL